MDTNPFLNESSAPRRPALHALPSEPALGGSVLREALQSGLWIASSVRSSAADVGGIEALERLDAEPLPPDLLCWEAIGPTERPMVEAVVAVISGARSCLYDGEHEVIAHRIIERIATNKPELLQRGPADRLAAAVMWLVMRGNDQLHQGRGGITAQRLWDHFGVPNSATHARAMYRALGLAPVDVWATHRRAACSDVWLYDPALLHSTTRRTLIAGREALVRMCQVELERAASSRPIRDLGDGQIQITGRQVTVSGVMSNFDACGRPAVLVMLGGTMRDPDDVLALTLGDAEHLAQALDRVLYLEL